MKRTLLITLMMILFLIYNAKSSNPPNPPGHGLNGSQGGGGNAPLGSGLIFFLTMGAAYGAGKVYKKLKNDREDAN